MYAGSLAVPWTEDSTKTKHRTMHEELGTLSSPDSKKKLPCSLHVPFFTDPFHMGILVCGLAGVSKQSSRL